MFQSLIGILADFNADCNPSGCAKEILVSIPHRDFSRFQRSTIRFNYCDIQFQSLIGILADFNGKQALIIIYLLGIGFQSLIGILADFNSTPLVTFLVECSFLFQSLIGILADFNLVLLTTL